MEKIKLMKSTNEKLLFRLEKENAFYGISTSAVKCSYNGQDAFTV